MIPLQTHSGFHYVNSFPIKTLSKQIFREQQKEEVVNGPRRENSGWGEPPAWMFALSFVGKVTSAGTQRCHPGPLQRWSAALMLVCLWAFQFKALICMCEMCCSGVKCSAVPSSTEIAAHSHSSWIDGGGRRGWRWGTEEEEEDEEREGEEGEEEESHQHLIFNLAEKKMFCVFVQAALSFTLCFLFLSQPLPSPSCLPVSDSEGGSLGSDPCAPLFAVKE